MRPSIGLVSSCLTSAWIAFIPTLTVVALKIFFCWHFNDTGRQTVHPIYS